jgi:hypothetical protein
MFAKSACPYEEKFKAHLDDTSSYGNVHYMAFHRWIAHTKEDFFLKNAKDFSLYFKNDGVRLVVLT